MEFGWNKPEKGAISRSSLIADYWYSAGAVFSNSICSRIARSEQHVPFILDICIQSISIRFSYQHPLLYVHPLRWYPSNPTNSTFPFKEEKKWNTPPPIVLDMYFRGKNFHPPPFMGSPFYSRKIELNFMYSAQADSIINSPKRVFHFDSHVHLGNFLRFPFMVGEKRRCSWRKKN